MDSGKRNEERSSALWGTGGNRGGETRSNALWGKGGRGFVTALVAALAVCVPLAASSSSQKPRPRSEEHTSELQSRRDLVCRLLLEKKKKNLTTQKKE